MFTLRFSMLPNPVSTAKAVFPLDPDCKISRPKNNMLAVASQKQHEHQSFCNYAALVSFVTQGSKPRSFLISCVVTYWLVDATRSMLSDAFMRFLWGASIILAKYYYHSWVIGKVGNNSQKCSTRSSAAD